MSDQKSDADSLMRALDCADVYGHEDAIVAWFTERHLDLAAAWETGYWEGIRRSGNDGDANGLREAAQAVVDCDRHNFHHRAYLRAALPK